MAVQSGQPPPPSHAHTPTGEQPPASTAPTGQQPPATAAPPAPTGQEPPASAMSGPLGGVPVGHEGIGGEDATLSSASLVDQVVVLAAAAAPPAPAAGQEIEPAEVGAPPAPAADQEIEPAEPPVHVHVPAAESEQDQEPARRARLFAEFLELVKKKPHWMSGRATGKSMHPELLKPVRCGHCGQLEDISRSPTPIPDGSMPPDHLVIVSDTVLVDQIAFKGNSCLTCVKMIYEKTRRLLCQRSSEQAGSDTPLHYAARSRNFRMLFHYICLVGNEYGLERVAQVLRKLNRRNETALHEAIWRRNMYIAELLMWVDPALARYPPPGQGTSPLFLAVSLGYGHIGRMLLCTSDGNLSYSGPDGQNALHAASVHAYAMIPALLERKRELSNEKDRNDSTPLHLVSAEREPLLFQICCFRFPNIWFPLENLATWRVLQANTSAACQQDRNGLFPIHIAALMNSVTSVRVLLRECPRCIGFCDNQGRSFLHTAVQNRSSLVVRYVCGESSIASIMNAQNNDGNTALHLAVDVGDLSAFCALLGNLEVLLNIRNNKDQTPRDLAWSKRTGFSYGWNPEWVIHKTLSRAGGRSASFWRDRLQRHCNMVPLESQEDKEKKEEKELDKVTDSTRTLGIGLVLIASVTFTAAFTVPAGIKANDHTNDGTPELLGTWYFNAFMMANALAFICSSIAIVGLMFAGMPLVKLPIRRMHLKRSVFFASSSLTCLNAAFALGVYMVLAPVGRKTAITICAFTPLVLIYRNADHFLTLYMISRPLYVRRGFKYVFLTFTAKIFQLLIIEFWPLALIFMWRVIGLA